MMFDLYQVLVGWLVGQIDDEIVDVTRRYTRKVLHRTIENQRDIYILNEWMYGWMV